MLEHLLPQMKFRRQDRLSSHHPIQIKKTTSILARHWKCTGQKKDPCLHEMDRPMWPYRLLPGLAPVRDIAPWGQSYSVKAHSPLKQGQNKVTQQWRTSETNLFRANGIFPHKTKFQSQSLWHICKCLPGNNWWEDRSVKAICFANKTPVWSICNYFILLNNSK